LASIEYANKKDLAAIGEEIKGADVREIEGD